MALSVVMALLHRWADICLCCLVYSVAVQASDPQHRYIANTHLNDVSFTSHTLFPFAKVRSLLDCSRRCASRGGCKAFTYLKPSHSCQGYSVWVAPGVAHVDLPRARTYIIPEWISTACVSNADCVSKIPDSDLHQTSQLPTCFKQRCLCYGRWYSVSKRLCVADCPNSQLHTSYTMYPDCGIDEYNSYEINSGDVNVCKQQCSAISDCQNFEISSGICFGATVSWVNFATNSPSWDHYQRNCV